ncbi:MAG: decaprenyl-phosphate phosphoribosyltransferase [Chloroflexi bacterium]|nr:decaprenyl-phosphate phosphoribosyltransferase [Chloroflexota bacterium]
MVKRIIAATVATRGEFGLQRDRSLGHGDDVTGALEPIRATESRIRSWARLVRPKQWAKNALLFLPFAFTLNLYWDVTDPATALSLAQRAAIGFVVYCALASAGYIINDLADIKRDRAHPDKRNRPLASGRIRPVAAGIVGVLLLAISLAVGFALSVPMGWAGVGYAVLTIGYSLVLKHVLIIDILAVAGAYVLRVLAGALVIDVPISPWLYLCTILGALFISIMKRRAEVELLDQDGPAHRKTLDGYSVPLLDQMIAVVTPSMLLAYALYTFTAENLPDQMMWTIPFVIYGLFRYLYLVHNEGIGGKPEDVLLKDVPLLLNVVGWLATSMTILFVFPRT